MKKIALSSQNIDIYGGEQTENVSVLSENK